MTVVFTCLNKKGLESILPHRGEALRKIDGVFHSSADPNTIFGIKEVHDRDKDLEGHFPGSPTYPGYAQDEFVCLAAAALIPLACKGIDHDPYVVQKVVRYKKNVAPGDTLTAEVTLKTRKARFFIFSARIINQRNEPIAEYEKIVGMV
jgi:3-hydroxymyristoyl/3-hydroxydecanoyl-(acyl carrier protein) dehydratase